MRESKRCHWHGARSCTCIHISFVIPTGAGWTRRPGTVSRLAGASPSHPRSPLATGVRGPPARPFVNPSRVCMFAISVKHITIHPLITKSSLYCSIAKLPLNTCNISLLSILPAKCRSRPGHCTGPTSASSRSRSRRSPAKLPSQAQSRIGTGVQQYEEGLGWNTGRFDGVLGV